MRVTLLANGKEYEAKRWKDMTENEQREAAGMASDLFESEDIFIKNNLEGKTKWVYVYDEEVDVIEE